MNIVSIKNKTFGDKQLGIIAGPCVIESNDHAVKMAKGDIEYQGKLLEARQSDWKDEFVLVVLTLPILVIAYGVFSEYPEAAAKIKEFFVQFQPLPARFTTLWILVVASIYGIKGTQIIRGGKK